MIGYKVVRKSKSGYKPATVWANQSFRYEIGQTTTRNPKTEGPLAIFKDIRSAEYFIHYELDGDSHLKILEVEYLTNKYTEHKLWKPFRKNAHLRHYNAWIEEPINTTKALIWRRQVPKGTLFAESITPLRVIPRGMRV